MKYKGQELAPVLTILRRLVAAPIFLVGSWITFVGQALGWGLAAARANYNGPTL